MSSGHRMIITYSWNDPENPKLLPHPCLPFTAPRTPRTPSFPPHHQINTHSLHRFWSVELFSGEFPTECWADVVSLALARFWLGMPIFDLAEEKGCSFIAYYLSFLHLRFPQTILSRTTVTNLVFVIVSCLIIQDPSTAIKRDYSHSLLFPVCA